MRELQRTTVLAVVYVFIAAIVLSPICNYAHLDSALYLGDVRFIADAGVEQSLRARSARGSPA